MVDSANDYIIEYPIEQRKQIYLGPTVTRSCINVTAVDDSIEEDFQKELTLILHKGGNSSAIVRNSFVQIAILDNDSEFSKIIINT